MNNSLKVSKSIEIEASPSSIWNALTNPEKIKHYLFGTEAITDWKVGSPIVFQGEYNGHAYQDKGNVLECKENEQLTYNYWSSMSGLEDKIENYFLVNYSIGKLANNRAKFTWEQEGFPNEEKRKHTENGLPEILKQIKTLSE